MLWYTPLYVSLCLHISFKVDVSQYWGSTYMHERRKISVFQSSNWGFNAQNCLSQQTEAALNTTASPTDKTCSRPNSFPNRQKLPQIQQSFHNRQKLLQTQQLSQQKNADLDTTEFSQQTKAALDTPAFSTEKKLIQTQQLSQQTKSLLDTTKLTN